MSLVFFAADTMGVTLQQQADGRLKASEVHQIRLGPWRLDLQIDVDSDILAGTEMGFWVRLGKSLRAYVIVRDRENWLFIFDTEVLKTCGAKTGFAGRTTKSRVQEFKPAIRGLFRWSGHTWDKVQYDGKLISMGG